MVSEELPEDILIAISGGYRNAANFFRYFVEELEARYGKGVAHEIARAVVRRKGLAAGDAAAALVGRGGLEELAAAHRRLLPTTKQMEISPTRYVAEDEHCFICQAWRGAGVSAERVRELGDIYCWGDLAFAQAFNPAIELRFEGRQVEGEPRCRWIFSLKES